jgi:TP901-1 family phage major tail protein
MSDNFVLGLECKLYFSATLVDDGSNTPDQISWTEIGNAKDVTLNCETGEADITTRANNGWRATAATLKDGSIEFEALWKPGDGAFDALQSAWAAGDEIAIAAMDGAIATVGKQGLAGNFTVTNFSRNEPLEEAVTVSITLKPSSFTQWYEVAAP